MWIRRIIWIIMIVFSFILYIFLNSPATLTVFICLLIIPAVSYIVLRLSSGKLLTEISVPPSATKDNDITAEFSVYNKGFPLGIISVAARAHNVRTGDETELKLDTGGAVQKKIIKKCVFRSGHCGKIEIDVGKITVTDILGMFKKEGSAPQKASVTVYPNRFLINVSFSNSASALLDGEKYSRTQTGNDSSETMGIKEYVPGDPVKNMHWKLSAKTDKLLVKEFGQPVVDQVCLFSDMSVPGEKRADEVDIVADVFASIADSMLQSDIETDVGWQDPESGVLVLRHVRSEEELIPVLNEMMGVPVRENGISISDAIAVKRERLGYAHVVVIGVSPELDMAHISNGASATLILPDTETISDGLQKDGTSIIAFNKKEYKNELAQIEI